jgi:hypothetical protein
LKNSSDRQNRVAIFKFLGKWMFNQFYPRLYFVFFDSSLEG